tara:strand:+ start:4389 stop:4745 length:357 start_codon:yes stop_codon:yes gene_type:complete
MATELTKDLIRVSTDKVDDKEIIIKLTSGQKIELKLKGSRGVGGSIGILELYENLHGVSTTPKDKKDGSISVKPTKSSKEDKKLISLYDLRSHNAISTLDLVTIAKFDQIIKSLIDER